MPLPYPRCGLTANRRSCFDTNVRLLHGPDSPETWTKLQDSDHRCISSDNTTPTAIRLPLGAVSLTMHHGSITTQSVTEDLL